MEKLLEQFKKEFYKKSILKIDTTNLLGDELPVLGLRKDITEIGKTYTYNEQCKVLMICFTWFDDELNEFINVNPEIFKADNIEDAWLIAKDRIMLDYNFNKLR